MHKKLLFSLTIALNISLIAQNHTDALRYSKESLWGSARYTAMGGAFGALGATGMTASYNPAGIAVLTSGQFTSTLNLNTLENHTTFYGIKQFSKNPNINIPNINYTTANIFDPKQVGDWNRYNFSIGFNKLDDYNSKTSVIASQNTSSLADYFVSNSNGTIPSELGQFNNLLAFNTYLIDTIPGSTTDYFSPVNSDMNKQQSYRQNTFGSKNEFYISFGTAYKDKLFLGATIGFPTFNYTENTYISEEDFVHDSDDDIIMNSFNYKSHLHSKGSGINLKLGLIYKLEDNIRYGFALHTPTSYEISEEYQTEINTYFENGESYQANSTINLFDYRLRTPFKIINSLALVISKKAIISTDYEYLDYSNSMLQSDFANFNSDNDSISLLFNSTHNLKLGVEYRLHPQLSLRAGYSYYGSPYLGDDSKRESLSFGLGIQVERYFFDLAIVNSTSEYSNQTYNYQSFPVKREYRQAMISAGIKF